MSDESIIAAMFPNVFPTPTTTWWTYDLDEDSPNYNEGEDGTATVRSLVDALDASEARAEAAERERDEWQRIAKGLAEESVPMLTDHLVVAESRLAAAYSALEAILEEAEYGSWTYALAFNALPDAQPQPTPSPEERKMSEPVSGGGAISNEELARIRAACADYGTTYAINGREIEAIIARLRASEARAEAAEREAERLKDHCPPDCPCLDRGTVTSLYSELSAAESRLAAAEERERSCYAWAKAARDKGSGLPPSRALRWIDEMGDRVTALDAQPQPTPSPGDEK